MDVHAGGERAAATAHDDRPDRLVARERLEGRAQAGDELGLEEIQRRSIKETPDDVAAPLDGDRRGHQYRRIVGSTLRAHASSPPARFLTFLKPCCSRRYWATAALRTP